MSDHTGSLGYCDGTGKQRYSYRGAKQRAANRNKHTPERVKAYHCAWCQSWHYGSTVIRTIQEKAM